MLRLVCNKTRQNCQKSPKGEILRKSHQKVTQIERFCFKSWQKGQKMIEDRKVA